MREIKFRAWDTTNNPAVMDYCGLERAGGYHESVGHHIMQYTGLKDKDGKEIYEGDIVRMIFHSEEREVGEIIFSSDARFVWKSPKDSDGYGLRGDDFIHREVIGNIHQNPELLKESGEGKK